MTARVSRRCAAAEDARRAWGEIGRQPAVLEAFVDFEREVSVVAARGARRRRSRTTASSRTRTPSTSSTCRLRPRRRSPRVEREAIRIARATLEALDVVGLLCVEMFLTRGGRLLDQRARAAAAQLGTPDVRRRRHQPVRAAAARRVRPAARVDGAGCGPRRWRTCSAISGPTASRTGRRPAASQRSSCISTARPTPRPGRKMGHLTAMADTPVNAARTARAARAALSEPQLTNDE